MKISDSISRHAFIVFFWCAVFTAIVCLESIAAFVVLMPDNEHGRQGVYTAYRAFGPGVLAAVLIAGVLPCPPCRGEGQ
jgi:hypothetical protein